MDLRKRSRNEAGPNFNGGFKKSKPEMDSLSGGIGSKTKPCTKFFSTAGCPFGESCHFLHYVPGGYNAVAQMMNLGPAPASRNVAAPPMSNGNAPAVKTKICNKFNTAEGCKFGDKCNFAHGEWEIGKPIVPSQEDPRAMGVGPNPSRFGGRVEPAVSGPAASFGTTATAKISVDASLAGAIIGKGGVNSKQICRQTGAKLAIRDHETDTNLRNIELEGTFEQISQASAMVRELINSLGPVGGPGRAPSGPGGPGRGPAGPGGPAPPMSNYKTKLCENFAKGSCTFGERCHFAHRAIWAIYVWCRRTDELVDGPNASYITPTALDRWEDRLENVFNGRPFDMLDAALSDTVSNFPVDIQPFRDMIEGMRMDLRKSRYNNFDELYLYCYYVAGTVGLMSVPIMGIAPESKATTESVYNAALALGIANQLTNILRDVGEDARRGRVYLPQDELAQAGLSDEDIFAGRVTDKWRIFMKKQIQRARKFFDEAEKGVTELTAASRFPVWASLVLYRKILDEIEANDYNNFTKRAYVSKSKKLLALPIAYAKSLVPPSRTLSLQS